MSCAEVGGGRDVVVDVVGGGETLSFVEVVVVGKFDKFDGHHVGGAVVVVIVLK